MGSRVSPYRAILVNIITSRGVVRLGRRVNSFADDFITGPRVGDPLKTHQCLTVNGVGGHHKTAAPCISDHCTLAASAATAVRYLGVAWGYVCSRVIRMISRFFLLESGHGS